MLAPPFVLLSHGDGPCTRPDCSETDLLPYVHMGLVSGLTGLVKSYDWKWQLQLSGATV